MPIHSQQISAPLGSYGHALHIFWRILMGSKSDTLDENGAFLLSSWGKPHKLHQRQVGYFPTFLGSNC